MTDHTAGTVSNSRVRLENMLDLEGFRSLKRSVRSLIAHVQIQLGRRYRQVRDVICTDGALGLANRMRRVGAEWLAPRGSTLPVRRSDVMAADLGNPFKAAIPTIGPGEKVGINWVTTPPSPGSGGHTTLFRIVKYLERHGYSNRIYFYDVYGGDHRYYESIVRNYYGFTGPVRSVDSGMQDAHAVIATGWPTAYPVFNSRCAGKRFYFVQDFEPYFFPLGTLSFLAESTFRMGFHGISIGQCFVQKLRKDFGMVVDWFDYGCDRSRYFPLRNAKRSGVVFYARAETARRGCELGLMALELFAKRQPHIDIHIYGDKMGELPFAFIDHGKVTPNQLNEIYNQCYAGLSLSFTNVSLVAQEMLAAGCIPVVNDTPEVRMDFRNPFVHYVPPYPQQLASTLEEIVTTSNFDLLSEKAVKSIGFTSWDDAGAAFNVILRKALKLQTL